MIATSIQLGEPVEHRGIVIAPLFPRRTPDAAYVTLEQALPLGFRVDEVSEQRQRARARRPQPDRQGRPPLRRRGAARREAEPDPQRLRARRRRREDADPRLVRRGGPLAQTLGALRSAPHASHPELRRRKVEQLAATPLARGSGTGDRLGRGAREGCPAPGALADGSSGGRLPLARGSELRALEQAFALAPGQCGAVFALGDSLCLDYVSRPDAFVSLYPKLRAGYLLDAIERLDEKPADTAAVERFVEAVRLQCNRAAAVRRARR